MNDKQKDKIMLPFIIFISVILFFYRLGETALTNWDEAWFGSVAQDMVSSGNLLTGKWNGQTFFYEPPLLVWLLSLSIKVFGESEFWLRSVSAIAGLFTVVGCYFLTFRITKSRPAGILSGLIILSDIEFLFRSRQVNVEILLTVLLLWSMIFISKAYESNRRRWIFFSAICLGLAFLTKRASPVLALPAVGYLLLKTTFREHPVPLFIFFITFITVTLPWYLLSYFKWGDQFINEFFIGYTLNKIKSVNVSIGTSPFFYLNSIKHAFKFWSLLIPLAAVWAAVTAFRDRKIAGIMIFILTFLFFLTLAPIKSSWFFLPPHPFLAILIGLFISRIVKFILRSPVPSGTGRSRIPLRGTKLHNQIIVISDAAKRRSGIYADILYSFQLASRRSGFRVGVILVVIISLAGWQLYRYRHDYIVPDTTGNQAMISSLAGALSNKGEPIYLDDEYLPVAVFYSHKKIIPLRFSRTVNRVPSQTSIPDNSLILTNPETFPALKSATGILFEELFSVRDLILVRAKGFKV
ncbi:glycosyltransferase family 39 protein [Candidatus Collierbacteria bacterium]|nr:glycosyltransferase family 39 protein [Candidatus Collierbacteria bacterium]